MTVDLTTIVLVVGALVGYVWPMWLCFRWASNNELIVSTSALDVTEARVMAVIPLINIMNAYTNYSTDRINRIRGS